MKNIAKIRRIDEKRSIMLKTSPVKTNNPLKNNNPEQKSRRFVKGWKPKISIRNTKDEIKSMPPNTFTIIEICERGALRRFVFFNYPSLMKKRIAKMNERYARIIEKIIIRYEVL